LWSVIDILMCVILLNRLRFDQINFSERSGTRWQYRMPKHQGGKCTPENFKTLHSNFDICRNFQTIKMKFYILIILRNLIWIFLCLACWLAPSKIYLEACYLIENFVNDWYSTTNMLEVSTWAIVQNVRIFKAFFVYLFVYYFVLDRPQFAFMKLNNIRVPLNRANCWNFQID